MDKREWSAGETDVLAGAVGRAPSVHNIQPWRLELSDGNVDVFERTDLSLPYHDPLGRDRSISCGAAVANLEVALRVLSLEAGLRLLPLGEDRDLVASLSVEGALSPTEADLRRYSAIERRRSYRRPFAGPTLSEDDLARLVGSAGLGREQVRRLRGEEEIAALAELLESAALALKSDQGYQRELAIWTIRDEGSHVHGAGIADSALPASSLPWAGLVRNRTALPDHRTLAERLLSETVLVFATEDDGKHAHMEAGMAMQRLWLAAVVRGFVGAVQTHPLHLPEARRRFREALDLQRHPQLLMRLGRPWGSVSQSPRRHESELFHRRDP